MNFKPTYVIKFFQHIFFIGILAVLVKILLHSDDLLKKYLPFKRNSSINIGKIEKVIGLVYIRPHNELAWQISEAGETIFPEDLIKTEQSSQAYLEFLDNTKLIIPANSKVQVVVLNGKYKILVQNGELNENLANSMLKFNTTEADVNTADSDSEANKDQQNNQTNPTEEKIVTQEDDQESPEQPPDKINEKQESHEKNSEFKIKAYPLNESIFLILNDDVIDFSYAKECLVKCNIKVLLNNQSLCEKEAIKDQKLSCKVSFNENNLNSEMKNIRVVYKIDDEQFETKVFVIRFTKPIFEKLLSEKKNVIVQ